MQNGRYRFLVLKIMAFVMLAMITVRLFSLQIINGEVYYKTASSRLSAAVVNKAPRGDILDRYGNVLVSNKSGYSVLLHKASSKNEKINSVVGELVKILISTENGISDTLPISVVEPYEFVFSDDTEKENWFMSCKYTGEYINSDMTAQEVLDILCSIYEIQGYDGEQRRYVAGIRYMADVKEFSSLNPITVAENINAAAVAEIKQANLDGVSVTENYVRQYTNPGFATHILGRVGQISAEEYEKNKDKGYGINDIIGKQGVERWAESYLRGTDGIEATTAEVDGKEVELAKKVEPTPGNYVMLTIDSELQKTLESSLENTINSIGNDCKSGAAVVLDCNSGDTLAIASYPTYDMSRFNEDYSALVSDKSNPMINRAVSGLYSPGSTFKPLTAIAGIQSGVLKKNETITCTGVYRYYEDYQPSCWIWSEYNATHSHQDVTQAIENSCNVFFYELGRRLGIDRLDEYAKKFGLGEYTGIELTEEASGHMASPEYKKEVVLNVIDSGWFGGDTLQAAIGQSYSLFTPVQLANYCATVANGGTRYKVNLIDSIRSSVDGSVVEEFQPQVVEKIDIAPDTMSKIHDGMKKVVDEGSARSIFEGYPIKVGGKTGTAQLGGGANNAIFIAFAPFDNPQIAIAVVLEHGVRGTNAGRVARDVFDQYFFGESGASESKPSYEGVIR